MSSNWIADFVDQADFTGLFVEELGWDRPKGGGRKISVITDEGVLSATEVATFHGISIWTCPYVPGSRVQRQVDRYLRSESTERVVIFFDDVRQVWRWPQSSDSSGVGSTRLVAHEHWIGKGNEALRQRLKLISIGFDESISVLELTRRLRKAFDSDKVTKSFYAKFSAQHRSLVGAISGIEERGDSDRPLARWYGSLLLNRLMFIYFMQRKGFLDGDIDYLRNRLHKLKNFETPGSFHEFYRDFLLPLFHDGLGAEASYRKIDSPLIQDLVGDVPYVNGGIFSQHQLEIENKIHIPNSAFEGLFDFFDQWQWHLDDRPTGNPNEINPDVLGYIFEQFVNNREEAASGSKAAETNADKGAYYTKEDVTGYMTSNTLVPVFLERFANSTGVNPWAYLTADPQRYIWPSLSYGAELELPDDVRSETTQWPRPTWESTIPNVEFGLPGESWFEVVDRRRYFESLVRRVAEGGISSVEDAITANLDLESLAIDVIDALDNPEHVAQAWKTLTDLNVVDPTCGSGAFLFAALNILHRLYSAVYECAITQAELSGHSSLIEIIGRAAQHPNLDYFLLKHASINNLHGVDIMPEAVEIARLRLFLKLIAQVHVRADIEPLPDLEFNIRSGNVLVGALDVESIRARVDILNYPRVDELVTHASEAAKAFQDFATMQISGGYEFIQSAKRLLEVTTNGVRQQLDRWWFESASSGGRLTFEEYLAVNSPFHWFIEFPGVFAKGGFDVIIGNPPYVSKTKISYQVEGFQTSGCPDIYAACLERAAQIVASDGRLSMILPMNLAWGGEYKPARSVLSEKFNSIWVSTYDQMPSRLFEGVATRNTIVLAGMGDEGICTTSFNKWVAGFRPHLMHTQRYIRHTSHPEPWPKVGHASLIPFATSPRGGLGLDVSEKSTSFRIGHKKIANYWLSVFTVDPPALDGLRRPVPQKAISDIYLNSESDMYVFLAIASTKLMFLWWIFTADMFHVKSSTFTSFPLTMKQLSEANYRELELVGREIEATLAAPGEHLLWTPYAGEWYGNYDFTRLREITDRADNVLRSVLGLSEAIQDIEVELRNYMKSGGERPGTVRGAFPDRDR